MLISANPSISFSLSANRSAILDKALTVDEELASQVSARHGAGELADLLFTRCNLLVPCYCSLPAFDSADSEPRT